LKDEQNSEKARVEAERRSVTKLIVEQKVEKARVYVERRNVTYCSTNMMTNMMKDGVLLERKRENPYKRACEGHRAHSGYTFL
jgi:hypothetical protein